MNKHFNNPNRLLKNEFERKNSNTNRVKLKLNELLKEYFDPNYLERLNSQKNKNSNK